MIAAPFIWEKEHPNNHDNETNILIIQFLPWIKYITLLSSNISIFHFQLGWLILPIL